MEISCVVISAGPVVSGSIYLVICVGVVDDAIVDERGGSVVECGE